TVMFARTRWIAAAVCAAGLGMASLALVPSPRVAVAEEKRMETRGIIDTATGPGMTRVTTGLAPIHAAGLVHNPQGPRPLTVFAPTNEAFEKLPKGTVEDLLKPENKEKLTKILTFHVHAGDAIKAGDVRTMNLSTVNGKDLMVKAQDGKVWINDAQVIKTD